MDYTREVFAPLFRDLLHLEITLVSHPFSDRTSAPEPDAQVMDIMESYTAALQEANSTPTQSGEILEAANVAMEFDASSPVPEAVRSMASFAEIADYAEGTLAEFQDQQTTLDATAPAFEVFGGEATDDEQSEAKSRRRNREVDPQEQKVMRIRDNARHIDLLLKNMGYQAAQPHEIGRSHAAAEAMETIESPTNENESGDSKGMQWTPEGIMQIRKYWEIRPEDGVLMRTVIGMDGDVVAHINPAIAGEDFKNLHQLHDQSVATSVKFWGELAGILSDFVNNVIKSVVAR